MAVKNDSSRAMAATVLREVASAMEASTTPWMETTALQWVTDTAERLRASADLFEALDPPKGSG